VSHGGREVRRRDEALDAVDQIPVEGSQRRDVKGPDASSIARPQRLENGEQSGLSLPRPGRCDDEKVRPRPNLRQGSFLHVVDFRDFGAAEQLGKRCATCPASILRLQ